MTHIDIFQEKFHVCIETMTFSEKKLIRLVQSPVSLLYYIQFYYNSIVRKTVTLMNCSEITCSNAYQRSLSVSALTVHGSDVWLYN